MSDLDLARRTLEANALAFAFVRDGNVIATGTESGVMELLATVDRLGASARGASLADKVVGKAVALIVVHAGIVAVDTRLASESAVQLLKTHGVPLQVRLVVPEIRNRRNDGPCPMEHATQPFQDPIAGMARLRAFFAARA